MQNFNILTAVTNKIKDVLEVIFKYMFSKMT